MIEGDETREGTDRVPPVPSTHDMELALHRSIGRRRRTKLSHKYVVTVLSVVVAVLRDCAGPDDAIARVPRLLERALSPPADLVLWRGLHVLAVFTWDAATGDYRDLRPTPPAPARPT
jgi:hypothetical protein